MAISALAPAQIANARLRDGKFADRSNLQLVPDFGVARTADRKVFVIFLSMVGGLGLIGLLVINTLLAQDAFELRKLQAQVTTLNDQRDAVIKQIAIASSPEVLAQRAMSIGMVASQSPRFLSLVDNEQVAPGAGR